MDVSSTKMMCIILSSREKFHVSALASCGAGSALRNVVPEGTDTPTYFMPAPFLTKASTMIPYVADWISHIPKAMRHFKGGTKLGVQT